jgi:demethylmenaquinone methyltransferase/2-methoxy-6-polyprenyl-1,4-benzoquinol methylase
MFNVPKMFDEIAPSYDRVNRVLSLGQDVRWRKKVAQFVPLKPHLEILDLATGTGDQIAALYRAGLSIQRAVGIDLAEEMLKIGRSKLKAFPQVQLLHGNAEKLPFASESFDAATFSFGIRNVSDPLLSLQEIHRVLKKRGRCLILEFSMPNRWIRPFFLFYLRHVLPRLGGILSKHVAAYRYLNRTIETFPSGDAFLALLKSAQFSSLKRISMNFGSVSLYVGEKL